MAAIVTTFGVRELSAVDAIADAYSKQGPVVHNVETRYITTRWHALTSHTGKWKFQCLRRHEQGDLYGYGKAQ